MESSGAWTMKRMVTVITASVLAGLVVIFVCSLCGYYGYALARITATVHQLTDTVPVSCANTGDILLYNADITSSALNMLSGIPTILRTGFPWTHVAVVVVHSGRPYSVEFTLEPESASTAGSGVCVIPLSVRAETYAGRIAIRHLQKERCARRDTIAWARAMSLLSEPQKRVYNYTFIMAIWHRVGIPFVPMITPGDIEHAWICTDLVAYILSSIGVFAGHPKKNMLPADFSSAVNDMPFAPDIKYSAERLLVLARDAAH